ncbi:hypothetical protein QS306_05425 [Paraburkholderia bonniea]|uniref:hypothetical protein n=1 Tax=Paraburkholderia bonniea TaxID=2152891 RepID=UPI001FE8A4DA|nr:hypothetical protein [Paraburkholderia bonniea]WJF91085.1 hypothetical protein QS306_05425 [Paraburkholderia bonniea]WJF94400.1 hypothetical protein QS308_05430 [Paraburkholderia bonniea]
MTLPFPTARFMLTRPLTAVALTLALSGCYYMGPYPYGYGPYGYGSYYTTSVVPIAAAGTERQIAPASGQDVQAPLEPPPVYVTSTYVAPAYYPAYPVYAPYPVYPGWYGGGPSVSLHFGRYWGGRPGYYGGGRGYWGGHRGYGRHH